MDGMSLKEAIETFVHALQQEGRLDRKLTIAWDKMKPPQWRERKVIVILSNEETIDFSWAKPGEEFEKEH